jgi:hypothetical protein
MVKIKKTENKYRKDEIKPIEEVKAPIPEHNHNGNDAPQINLPDIFGIIETVDTAPTHTARNLNEQVKIYVNGATYRLYLYDAENQSWRYVSLT